MNGTSYQTARIDKCSVASDRSEGRERRMSMKFRGAMFAACLLEEAKEHKGAVKKEGDNDDRLVGCTVVGPGRKKISSPNRWTWQRCYAHPKRVGGDCMPKHSSL